MPVSNKESQQNINTLLGLGLTQDKISGYGNKLNPTEMQSIASKYGLTLPTSPSQVGNMDQAKAFVNSNQLADFNSASATANAVPTRNNAADYLAQFGGNADLNNLVAPTMNYTQTYNDLIAKNGVSDLETQLNNLKNQANTINDQFTVNKHAEESKSGLVPINVVEGRVSEQAKNSQDQLNTVLRQQDSVTNQLNSKYNTINQLMTLRGLDYGVAKDLYDEMKTHADKIENLQLNNPGAKIKITDSTDVIASKISKSKYRDSLNDAYLQVYGYIPNSKTKIKDIEKSLKKAGITDRQLKEEKDKLSIESIKADIEATKKSTSLTGTEVIDINGDKYYFDRSTGNAYQINPDTINSGFSTQSGMRTDRNNNPTAMTTDIAKQAGLKEGIDYVVGDQFPGNPNLKTAKLLGDPVKQTIKVIDKIGFYTAKGTPRWTHTAMSQKEWNALSSKQKKQVITDMYKKEGGNGSLVSGSLKNTKNNSAKEWASLIQSGGATIDNITDKKLRNKVVSTIIKSKSKSAKSELEDDINTASAKNDYGTREDLIKKLKSAYPEFTKKEISKKVYSLIQDVKPYDWGKTVNIGKKAVDSAITHPIQSTQAFGSAVYNYLFGK